MSKKRKNIFFSILAVTLFTGIAGSGIVYYYLLYPQFHPSKAIYIYIGRDDTTDPVLNKIKKQGNPHNPDGFKWMAHFREFSKDIHTGRYAIKPGDNAYHLYSRLSRGYQTPVNLTIGNVRTLGRLTRGIGKQLIIGSTEIATALYDPTFQEETGYTEATMPCLFIPETYQVYRDINIGDFFARMKKERNESQGENRRLKAKTIGMTPEEICTLASIIEEETSNNGEKPMVTGLYINHLHTGMPLQADLTTKLALQDSSLRRITNQHLSIQSPYNTYLNTGLPPGPIRVPSPKGLNSVLNYVKHDHIYMCAKEDFSGAHSFASNYVDHMVDAGKYWKALNERKILK